MAQAEDTELRDLVIDALEKNGSLAKIRALLRANVFLAFEDECENIKHNISLDNLLRAPEGILCLSLIHEFLEFCNLKNTLFVYMSESRQGSEYNYEGCKYLYEKLHIPKQNNSKEPLLLTVVKNFLKNSQRLYYSHNEFANKKTDRFDGYKDEENCTYIVHEDSTSSNSNSQSDHSSDEKNKLHLRLHLDHSDTDTSSDSAREKTSSEYIPNNHVLIKDSEINVEGFKIDNNASNKTIEPIPCYLHDMKLTNSSDSTSYADLKPYTALDAKMLNTTGIPCVDTVDSDTKPVPLQMKPTSHTDQNTDHDSKKNTSSDSGTSSNVSPLSSENLKQKINPNVTSPPELISETETVDYSLDFSSSPDHNKIRNVKPNSEELSQEKIADEDLSKISVTSPHQNSSTQSSVSISDVADLIENSEKNSTNIPQLDITSKEISPRKQSKEPSSNEKTRGFTDDSEEISVSSVPSLSNLSLDIHSD